MAAEAPSLECAVVGCKDNGKSTLINAFLGGPFTVASEEEGTICVTRFVLQDEGATDAFKTPNELRDEIRTLKDDNPAATIQSFNVIPSSPLVPLYHGLQLAISDFPGLDEKGQYKKQFQDKRYDLTIVLIDSSVVARTESFEPQKRLLKYIKDCFDVHDENCRPLIIGVNKVDDPGDPEFQNRLKKVTECIENIFDVSNRGEEGLKQWLNSSMSDQMGFPPGSFPLVIPMSAKNAFIWRRNAALSRQDFEQQLTNSEIKKIVVSVFGLREMKKMSGEELIDNAFEVSREENDTFAERRSATGFPTLMTAIRHCIGDNNKQGNLICQQLFDQMNDIVVKEQGGFMQAIHVFVDKQKDYSPSYMDSGRIFKVARQKYDDYVSLSQDKFNKNPRSIKPMQTCFKELVIFQDKLMPLIAEPTKEDALWSSMEQWVSKANVDILQYFIETSRKKVDEWVERKKKNILTQQDEPSKQWNELEHGDWIENIESLLESLNGAEMGDAISSEKKKIISFERTKLTEVLFSLRKEFSVKAPEQKNNNDSLSNELNWSTIPEHLQQYLATKKQQELQKMIKAEVSKCSEPYVAAMKDISQQISQKVDDGMRGLNEKIDELRGMNEKLDDRMRGMDEKFDDEMSDLKVTISGKKRSFETMQNDDAPDPSETQDSETVLQCAQAPPNSSSEIVV